METWRVRLLTNTEDLCSKVSLLLPRSLVKQIPD